MKNIKKYIENPRRIYVYLASKGLLNWLPDKVYLKIIFRANMGYKLNLTNPKTFSEKLQWIKVYKRESIWSKMVDKYEVREYIAETIGKQYLIPSLGVYNTFEEIDFDKLPQKFVLKCTHDSGGLIICKDKNRLDKDFAKKKIEKCLNKNYFYWGREWPYKNVKPRIVCEEFISDSDNTPDDYKVLCFNGKAKLIELHRGRFDNHTQDFYDINWNKTDISQDGITSDIIYERPNKLEEMIRLSEKIAQGIPHVRIDWFIINDKLYFGEITFFDGSGLDPFDKKEYDYMLGSWINLD